jgi:4-amino-4-deoxy-L-arabinose transferase-like glycosyltransferase
VNRALGWILLAAFSIRMLSWWVSAETMLASDELDYFWRAADRLHGREPQNLGFRPPAMEFVYAALFHATGVSATAARLLNIVLGVALLVPLHALGQRFGGARTGLLAAALGAVYPNWIAFSHTLWSETFYALLALTGLVTICSYADSRGIWKLVVAGLAFGVASLARAVGLAFPILAAAWLVWLARNGSGRFITRLAGPACLLAAVAVPIIPWSVHLNRPAEPFALITRSTWHYLYVGNSAPTRGTAPAVQYHALGDSLIEREAAARELVLPQIRERLPAWPFEKIASEIPSFFTPASFPVRRMLMPPDHPSDVHRAWSYDLSFERDYSPGLRLALAIPFVAGYVVIALLGAAGLCLAPRSTARDFGLLFVLSQAAPTILTFAISRFRFASMAVFLIGAAWLLLHGARAWREASTARRAGAVAAVTVLAGMIVLRWHEITALDWS